MNRILLRIGGVVNALFVIYHIWLGYRSYMSPGFVEANGPLLEMFNTAGVLSILFFAISSLCYAKEMLETRLGRLVALFVFMLYGSRAAEEIFVAPRFSPAIFIVCTLLALLYLFLFLRPSKPE